MIEIKLENYAKVLNIEAETCLMMAEKEILPACMKLSFCGVSCHRG